MIIVHALIKATEDSIAASRAAIATMEAASREESGCQEYTFSIDISDPAVLRVTERWDDMDALTAHFATPHMAEFQAAIAANPPERVEVSFYEAKEVPPPGN